MSGVSSAGEGGLDLGTGRAAMGLAVTSAAILMLEIGATRLMSFVSWHHFAFMVVSVAMLGLGAASVSLSLSKKLRGAQLGLVCVVGAAAQAVLTLVAYVLLVSARFSPVMLAMEFWSQIFRLAVTYLALILPFLAGGLVMASCLSRMARRSSVLYGADLLGAAVGSLAAVALAGPLSIEQLVLASGILAAGGALIFSDRKPFRLGLSALAMVSMIATCGVVSVVLPARPARGKSMQLALEATSENRGKILSSHNTPLGRVDVVQTPDEIVWSRNPRAPSERPAQLRIIIDGDAATPVALVDENAPDGLDYLDYLPSSFVFSIRRPDKVLILGAGGGQDVLSALRFDPRQIDAVEINPAIVRLMTKSLSERSGRIYERPGVNLIRGEGRSFVRGATGSYDVVQMGLVDTWAATSTGGLSLTENFLYTEDAFVDYLGALREGGMIGITRWLQRPPRETLRLTVLALGALERTGVADPARHVAVVGVERVAALIVAKDPFSESDIERISGLAREHRLDVLWLPGQPPRGEISGVFHRLLTAEDRERFIGSYPFDISSVDDDRPFFFDFNTPRGMGIWLLLGQPSNAALSGTATLAAVLAQAVLFSLLLLLVPFLSRRASLIKGDGRLLLYFGLTGTGFMFIEIPLLQRLTLIVGHPTQAAALVLCVLLGASGFASLLSTRITGSSRKRAMVALGSLGLLAMIEAVFGMRIGQAILETGPLARAVFGAGLVAPLGLLMGLPTPHGLRVAAQQSPRLPPLLWATTSFASVCGAVLSVMVSMKGGFGFALGIGATCYFLAGIIAPGVSRKN